MSDPALTVAAIVERDGRFLVVEERIDGQLVLNQPAGHVEPGELLSVAVVRETLEETGWTVRPEYVVGVYHWQAKAGVAGFLRVAMAASAMRHDAGCVLDTGIERALWLSRAELASSSTHLRSPMVLRSIDDYLAMQRQPIEAFDRLDRAQLRLRAHRL